MTVFLLKNGWAEIHSSQISNFYINYICWRTSAKHDCLLFACGVLLNGAIRDWLSHSYPRSAHETITRQHPNALPTGSPSVTSQGSKRVATASHYRFVLIPRSVPEKINKTLNYNSVGETITGETKQRWLLESWDKETFHECCDRLSLPCCVHQRADKFRGCMSTSERQ